MTLASCAGVAPFADRPAAATRQVNLVFSSRFYDAQKGLYRQDILRQLRLHTTDKPRVNPGDPDPTMGNRDFAIAFPAPGVIRLGVTGECSYRRPEARHLCAVRGEIGLDPDSRIDFANSAYYSIAINLAGTGEGARNLATDREYTQRLMLAQVKFRIVEPDYPLDFSPILALRFEDDQLYVTSEFIARRGVAPVGPDGRCREGMIAFRPARNQSSFKGTHRLLLAYERGDGPGDIPWEFDPTRNRTSLFECVLGLQTTGARVFPRQPRTRPFRVTMHIDGRSSDDAHVAVYIGNRFVACIVGEIADRVTGDAHDFKFGVYGDLPPGRQLFADYTNYRQGPTLASVGLMPARREDTTCRG